MSKTCGLSLFAALLLVSAVPGSALSQHTKEIATGKISHCLAFSPNGQLIAGPTSYKEVTIWNLEKGVATRVLGGHGTTARFVAFMNDRTVVTISHNGEAARMGKLITRAAVFDVKSGMEKKRVNVQGDPLDLSRDGKFLLSRAQDLKNVLLVHDILAGTTTTLKANNGDVICAAVSDGGRLIAARCEDDSVTVWKMPEGKQMWRGPPKAAHDKLVFVENGGVLASVPRRYPGYAFWNSATGELIEKRNVVFGAVSPDGKWIVAYDENAQGKNVGNMAFVSVKSGLVAKRIIWEQSQKEKDGSVWHGAPAVISADGRLVAVVGRPVYVDKKDRYGPTSVRIFEMPKHDP